MKHIISPLMKSIYDDLDKFEISREFFGTAEDDTEPFNSKEVGLISKYFTLSGHGCSNSEGDHYIMINKYCSIYKIPDEYYGVEMFNHNHRYVALFKLDQLSELDEFLKLLKLLLEHDGFDEYVIYKDNKHNFSPNIHESYNKKDYYMKIGDNFDKIPLNVKKFINIQKEFKLIKQKLDDVLGKRLYRKPTGRKYIDGKPSNVEEYTLTLRTTYKITATAYIPTPTYFSISKLDDDYYIFESNNETYLCDGLDGLFEFIEDRFKAS